MFKQKVIKIKDFAKLERALAAGFNVQYMLTPQIVLLSKYIPSENTNLQTGNVLGGTGIMQFDPSRLPY